MLAILPVILAYLVGAIPFALVVSRLAGIGDIRKLGSGNIGATNVWRVAGFKTALWVFIGDIGKGVLAVLVGRWYVENFSDTFVSADLFLVVCAAAVILGHVFPVYLRFKGGKGVNTALGAILALLPIETLISFGIFALVLLLFRYVSLGSISGAIGFCVVIMLEKFVLAVDLDNVYVYLAVLVAVLIVFTHRDNISRLVKGTENRFSFSSGRSQGGSHG